MTTRTQATQAVLPVPFEVQLEAFELPEPGPGQVVVETEASAISAGTELAIYTGIHQWLKDPTRTWPKFPFVPGYSGVGHIRAIGENCGRWRPGDRVIWAARHASHALLDVTDPHTVLWPIGPDVPAPAAACAVLMRFPLTALVRAESILGQSVAVIGLGLIGQLTLRLFAAAGAYPLIGIDPLAGRRELAERTPGVATLDPNAGDLKSALRELNHGALPDIVVDATGAPAAVNTAMAIVVDGGKVIMVGSPRGIAGDVDFYWDLHGRSISLIGAHGSAIGIEPREKFPFVRDRALGLIAHLLETRRIAIDDLITHHVHASELQTMYEGLIHQREEYLGVTLHW
jgi:2-desacetyl-2-hydroxyethyl bacteriochlorophyllide A dehydrogenase